VTWSRGSAPVLMRSSPPSEPVGWITPSSPTSTSTPPISTWATRPLRSFRRRSWSRPGLGQTAHQCCWVHFARNLLALVPKTHTDMVAAGFRTIFAKPDAQTVAATWNEVRDQLAARFPRIGPLMDEAKAEVLAFTGCPPVSFRCVSLSVCGPSDTMVRRGSRRDCPARSGAAHLAVPESSTGGAAHGAGQIGVDFHKLSVTIEVVDGREKMLGSSRFTTNRAGYAAMRKYARS
jgi:Transposase, Mutator family